VSGAAGSSVVGHDVGDSVHHRLLEEDGIGVLLVEDPGRDVNAPRGRSGERQGDVLLLIGSGGSSL
jgi:hypothetical protein